MVVIAITAALTLCISGLVVVSRLSDTGGKPGFPTNSLFDAAGNLAMPAPQLAGEITVAANDDGSTAVDFSIEYAVAHPRSGPTPLSTTGTTGSTDAGPKGDSAIVTVLVSPLMGPGGPIRLSPMFSQTVVDHQLADPTTKSSYSVRLSPAATTFLAGKGMLDGDAGIRRAALRYIDIDVQQMRDFKVVDGEWDWQHGRAFTAADQPVQGSITDDSTVTVNNNTAAGLFGPPGPTAPGDTGNPDQVAPLYKQTDALATNLSLAGSAVECIDQGDGSNPQGFSMLNGWDIEDDLAPGVVPPGASVTQHVNANESLGTSSLDIAENTSAGAVQVLAAVGDYATGGVKDAATYAYLLALGIDEISSVATVALGVPIMAILGLVDGIYESMTDSCASFANMFNLTAAEPTGAQASYTWGDQTNGLDLVYDSASFNGTPVTDNVQLSTSNGIVSLVPPNSGSPITVHPYLEQVASVACGTGNPGGCPSSGNNVIDVQWSVDNPCPFQDESDCVPAQSDLSALPEVDVPGTGLCGVNNDLCPTLAAPNSDASEVTGFTPEQLADLPPYDVVGEYQPDTAITALAATDDTTVFGAGADGGIYRFSPEGAVENVVSGTTPISAMVEYQGSLVFAPADGDLLSYDPSDGSLQELGEVGSSSEPVEQMTEVGGLVYLASADSLWALTSEGSINGVSTVGWPDDKSVTSMTAGSSYLFVGFQDGYVARCNLTDCANSWVQVHDGGFTSDANAMTAVGNTLYVGLDNGAQAQIDPVTFGVVMTHDTGNEGMSIGGMATVDGNVFVGGCIGQQSPVSGDLLGVVVLEGIVDGSVATYAPEVEYGDSCQNPTETTTKYKGFDPSTYAMLATPAAEDHPPLVFASLSINSGNFVYALESVAPFTSSLCLPEAGGCPLPPPPPPPPPSPPAAVGSVAALGSPQVVGTCEVADDAYTTASLDAPIAVSGGEITAGFQLTAPVSSAGCTTTFAWNLNNAGSLPYVLWQANAYATSASDATSITVLSSNRAPLGYSAAPQPVSPGGGTTIPSSGAQLSVGLATADALVLEVTTPPGADDPVSLGLNADVLTSAGQDLPPPSPLFGGTVPPAACVAADPTLSATVAALYPLDGTSTLVLDASGHGHNALATNPQQFDATPGPYVPCPDDGAMRFDGTSTYVAAPPTLDGAVAGTDLTVMAWVQIAEQPDDNPRLVSNDQPDVTGTGFQLALTQDRGGGFTVGTGGGAWGTATFAAPLTTGAWHQVVGVFDSPNLAVYVDGQPVGTGTVTDATAATTVAAGTSPVAIGYDPHYDGDYFGGLVADVAISATALDATQVLSVYDAVIGTAPPPTTTTTTAPPSTTPEPATTLPTTLPAVTTTVPPSPCAFLNAPIAARAEALWLLNDRSPSALDSSGHGHTATIADAVAYDQVPGPATSCPNDGGVQLNGTSSVVVAPASLNSATTGAALTVVAWFKPGGAVAGNPRIVANDRTADTGSGFQLWLGTDGTGITNGSFDVGAAGGVGRASWTQNLTPGAWYQYVGTYDGTTVTTYLNGVAVAMATTTGALTAGGQPVSMGYDPVQQTDYFAGYLADVAILSTAITPDTVSAMWTASQRPANTASLSGSPATSIVALALVVPLTGVLRRRRRAVRLSWSTR